MSSGYLALIPAAGVGARMEAARPKQYLQIAGKSILQHSVDAFLEHSKISHVYVVVSSDDPYVKMELASHARLTVLYCGGASRFDSVLNGLRAIQDTCNQGAASSNDWVLVHDAARPGLNSTLIDRLIREVGEGENGGLLALPVADTVKMHSSDPEHVTTIPRAGLWLAQTPQMFRLDQLGGAMTQVQARKMEFTDEASVMESMGKVPMLVQGHWSNTKITRPDDMAMIEMYLMANKAK